MNDSTLPSEKPFRRHISLIFLWVEYYYNAIYNKLFK